MSIAHQEAALDAAAVDALFVEARTANTFTGEVTDEQAQAIYELTKFGPTAFNNQPLRITYVRSAEARERLVAHMMPGNQEKTRTAPLVALLAFDTEWHEKWEEFLPAALRAKTMFDADESLRYGTGRDNAHLQAGYFILAVRALGFAAGPMTGANFDAIDAEFFPEGGRKSFLVVNIGLPGAEAFGPAKTKFAFQDVVETL
jgi:3-hydroxypropanoate dehydrogenase